MVSFTKNAENTPETSTMPASSTRGAWACSTTQALTTAKKPESRKLATTIIMPKSRMIVS